MLENETYEVVSFEEMRESQIAVEQANNEYKRLYKNFLITCLCKSGFAKKKVRHKKTGIVGVLVVESRTYYRPYEIKFYPIRKDGMVSLKAKYHGCYSDKTLVEELKWNFELVGE